MMFTMVAVAVPGCMGIYSARSDVSKHTTLQRTLPAATRPEHGKQHNENANQRLKPFERDSGLRSAGFRPPQFQSPPDLGIGKLLVASRGLGDPNFARTVILLIRYDDDGVVGLFLNRRTDVPISKVLDLKGAKDSADPVYLGGPVELSNVHALLLSSAKVEKGENIFGGVYLISDKSLFEQTISARPSSDVFHVYLGYAGWKPDQLRFEMRLGAWFVFPADAAAVFNADPDSLWLQMIQRTELKLAKAEPIATGEWIAKKR